MGKFDEVKIDCNNKGTKWQYFVVLRCEDNRDVISGKQWKTEAGARRWAEKNGYKVV